MKSQRAPQQLEASAALDESSLVVRRAQAGDWAAFRALFDRHAPSVRRFVRDLLGSDAAADEATQETFVRAHRRLSTLKEGHRVLSWLLGIGRHVVLEARRAGRGYQSLEHEGDADEVLVGAVLPPPTPEALLLDQELEAALNEAVAALSGPRRAVLLLRIDHGLSYDEISTVMGWSLAKVKNEIHRARLTLRVSLAPLVGDRR